MALFNINGITVDLPLTKEQVQLAAKQIRKEFGADSDYDYYLLDRDDRARFKRYTAELTSPALTLERRLDLAILLDNLLAQAQRINAEHLRD